MVSNFQKVQSLECETFQLGKHHRASFRPRPNVRVPHHFMLVHSDVWGLCRVISKLGFKYFVIFVDDHSRLTWLYLMKDRSELFAIFQNFCAEVKTQFGATIQTLRSDNATEYFSKQFSSLLNSMGTIHYSSQLHGYYLSVFLPLHSTSKWSCRTQEPSSS